MNGRGRYARWFSAYLLLAAFVIVTVSGSLLTHRRSMAIYRHSIEVNQLWAAEIEGYQRLELLVGQANAAGNDIFAAADPAAEAERHRVAMAAFKHTAADVRRIAAATASIAPDRDWRSTFDRVERLATEMSSLVDEIPVLYSVGRVFEAADRVAEMNRLHGEINLIMHRLQSDTQALQRENLERQLESAEGMRVAEYLVGALVALMVLALLIYGYRLSRRITEDEQERSAQLVAVESSERKFRELAEGSIEGIMVQRNGKPLFVNQAWAQLHNYENPSEALACGDLSDIVAAEDREAVRQIRYALQNGPASSRRYEYRARRTDGSIIWLECLERVILWQGRPAVQTTAIDITERKQAEEELKAAKLKAEQASNARTRFLAAASHDLRQPLHAISLYLPLLTKRIENPDALATVEAIRASSESMRSLLDSLLDISKLDAGMVEATIEPVPVLDILDQLAVETLPQAAEKSLQFRVVPSTLWVESDPTLLQRILRNLVSNALRYTRTGRILVGARRHADRVRIEVWDTGPGIAEEQQSRIFEEFFQADQPARDENPGIGLGLAIIDRLARLMNHDISVRSEVGKGSVFSVEMAAAEPPSFGTGASEPCEFSIDLSNVTALLIDDNSAARAAMAATLTDWGYEVLAASTTDEALALVAGCARSPCVIVSDLALGNNETGIGAVQRIHRLTGQPIPVMIVTGETDPERLRDVMDLNAMIFHKPIEPDAFRLALEGLVLNCGDHNTDRKTPVAVSHKLTGSLS